LYNELKPNTSQNIVKAVKPTNVRWAENEACVWEKGKAYRLDGKT
jgi:hypothetical protein